MSKHTAGDWFCHDEYYCPEDIYGNIDGPNENGDLIGTLVCTVNYLESKDYSAKAADEFWANVKLIRAAPKLLQALKNILESVGDLDKDYTVFHEDLERAQQLVAEVER